MLFNSYEFIFLFLPITFFIYFYLNKKELVWFAKIFLVTASLFFYSWWNINYLPLILVSIIINYLIGRELGKSNKPKKSLLVAGIIFNVGLLAYFKYVDFFIENINWIFDNNYSLLNLALPLAISFFTFQQIAYLVDSYGGETREYYFVDYCVFVSFFPQLIAGPIVHHREMMPQFADKKNKTVNYDNIATGLFLFSIGLFKKIVIADSFAVWASNGFDKIAVLTFFEAWATSLSYSFQLYFDFSGYVDMAIGSALLFNIRIPVNFNSPYKAFTIQEFWRRWHITLSRFLRDYIYIPLGGNRKGDLRTCQNLMITFIIGGIWHGAGWTFVFWGFLHGAAIVVQRLWGKTGLKLNPVMAWIVTFNFVNIAWIFFRAKEWQDAIKVLKGMVGINGIAVSEQVAAFLTYINPLYLFDKVNGMKIDQGLTIYTMEMLFAGFILVLCFKNTTLMLESDKKYSLCSPFYYSGLFLISLLCMSLYEYSEFIYFNF